MEKESGSAYHPLWPRRRLMAAVARASLAQKETIERRTPSFQLRNLVEILLLQFCGSPLMQLSIRQLALGLFDRLNQVIGQGTIIGATDMRIGRCLRIPTAGDEQLLNVRMNDVLLSLTSTRSLAQLPAKCPAQLPAGLGRHEIQRTREVPLPSGSIERIHHARDGAGMTAIHDDSEVYP